MKKTRETRKKVDPKNWKRKFLATLSMVLVSAILLTTSTFAWLVLSVAPEISGITTNIGANGSLEIALLNTETREDTGLIRSTVGESLALDASEANYNWGNLIDLSKGNYGLGEIKLLPSRLSTQYENGQYRVQSGLLSVPTYGYDGRVVSVTNNAVSAVYTDDQEFAFVMNHQDYGVRAIGTSNTLSVQGSALATAKGNISTYTKGAKNAAIAAMQNNGDALFNIIFTHATSSGGAETYDRDDLATLESMVADLQSSLDYIDLALRQGMIVIAASEISNEDDFELARTQISNTAIELKGLLGMVDGMIQIPSEFQSWVQQLDDVQMNLNSAQFSCAELRASENAEFTWAELSGALDVLMDLNYVFFNNTKVPELSNDINSILNSPQKKLTLTPGSGIFSKIADFTDNYDTAISPIGMDVQVEILTDVPNPFLPAMYEAVSGLEAADGSTEGDTKAKIHTTYGYAVDLAFRCNAPASDLLLQTDGVQRVYSDSESAATMGGGSYMEFNVADSDLTQLQTLRLIDAVRIGFLDDQNVLLGVAKLNTSNYAISEDVIKAAIYLYDFELDQGAMIIGERRKTDNILTSLDQNIAKALTVVVWLDGDKVDNTMVSSSKDTSLNGTLNLQFASSADLIPADNSDLKGLTTEKGDLEALLDKYREVYEAGQGLYTTVSWQKFSAAYAYAEKIHGDLYATESQTYIAAKELLAATGLELATHEALTQAIATIREVMGQTEDEARIVLEDENGKYYTLETYTEEQFDNRVDDISIYRVDYEKNLKDEGNGVKTPIYTDESWTALAASLYEAEALNYNANATSNEMDAAITALDLTYKALQHKVFYIPYEMDGALYYFAISEETDTYGKWYTTDYKRVLNELTIIELDSKAEPAEIGGIDTEYVSYVKGLFTPTVEIYDTLYTALKNEEIIAIHWNESEYFVKGIIQAQIDSLKELKSWAAGWLTAPTDTALVSDVEALVLRADDILVTKSCEETYAVAEQLIYDFEQVYKQINPVEQPEETAPADTDPMTSDQRILLTAAVNSAKSVEGYDDLTKTELDNLRLHANGVEQILTSNTVISVAQAKAALDALNVDLTTAGKTEVTAYNTLTYKIPVGSELFDIAYEVDNPRTSMYATGERGTETMTAVVLTRSGVVFTAKKDVQFYSDADGLKLMGKEGFAFVSFDNGTSSQMGLALGVTGKLDATELYERHSEYAPTEEGPFLDDNGNNLDGEVYTTQAGMFYKNIPHDETIEKWTWAVDDPTIASISVKDGICTVSPANEGETCVRVSVKTHQGRTYTATFGFTVYDATKLPTP